MSHDSSTRQRGAVRRGVAALIKSCLLVLGVPIALLHLVQLGAARSYSPTIGLTIHLILGGVTACWLVALFQLGNDIVRTARTPEDRQRGSWSSSWAAGIVGLLLLAGSLSTQGMATSVTGPVVQTIGNRPGTRTTFEFLLAPAEAAEELLGGLGILLACGLRRRLRLLTRLRLATRAGGGEVPPPPIDLERFERSLERTRDDRLIDWIEAANRALGSCVRSESSREYPEILLVRAGIDGIELLLQRPIDNPPPPFLAMEGGSWWRLDPTCTLAELTKRGAGAPRFVPWLLPVGDDGSSELLVALPPGQVLGILGGEDEVDAVQRSLVMSMRVLPWCDELNVELLGIDPPALNQHSVHLQRSSMQTIAALGDRPPSPRQEMHDRWRREPLVVAHRRAFGDQNRVELLHASEHAGMVLGGGPGTLTLAVDGERGMLQPFGLPLNLHHITQEDELLLDRLLDTYAQPLESTTFEDRPHPAPTSNHQDCFINILGRSVELVGAHRLAGRDDRDRIHELLVFLALHGYRATRKQLRDALLAERDRESASVRLENLIAMTRAVLGTDQFGVDRLRVSPEGSITLERTVGVDWYELEHIFSEARRVDGIRALELLHGAIGEIDSQHFFAEPALYPWLRAMRYDEYIKGSVIDACHHLATLAFAMDDPLVAKLALDVGRTIEPASEILARDQMVFASTQGSAREIEKIYRDLTRTLNELAGAEPSMTTHRLFLSLRTP